MTEFTDSDIQRFWDKSRVGANGCLLWTGSLRPDGRGWFGAGGIKHYAYRVAWTLTHGPIPDGLVLDHTCRNPSCINIQHLRVVTRKQNSEHLDERRKGNSSGHRGVYFDKDRRKWAAQITHFGKTIALGRFETREAAAEAARLKRLELFTHSDADRTVSP